MFIVYAPEGRSFIGRKPKIPPLRVDPMVPVHPIEKDVLDGAQADLNVTSPPQKH
jgi:hypothetical protein